MGCRILVGREQGSAREIACFVDSTNDWVFGPVFMDGEEEAEEYLLFLGCDPCGLSQEHLEARYVDFRNDKRAKAEQVKKMVQASALERSQRIRDVVKRLESEHMQCNCDLDRWEPERSTGHGWVCQIHKAATREMQNA